MGVAVAGVGAGAGMGPMWPGVGAQGTGSTNAVVHLLAIIGRHPTVAGTITLDTFNEIGEKTPLLVDLKPSGSNYMTDFHDSGKPLSPIRTGFQD